MRRSVYNRARNIQEKGALNYAAEIIKRGANEAQTLSRVARVFDHADHPRGFGNGELSVSEGVLTREWLSLWTQHTLFTDYFFLPILLGVACAYLVRLENANHNWNKVFTMPARRSTVFLAKLLTAAAMLLVAMVWICALFVISGFLAGLTNPPWASVARWCALGTLGGSVIVSIQLLISMNVNSFAAPIGLSFAGGLSGLAFLAKNMGHVWPYSLMAYGMNANAPQKLAESGGYAPFAVTCLAYLAVFTAIGAIAAARRDR